MKLRHVRIQNFRGFADETFHLDDYTCLVGPNGAGKSTLLSALNVFFRESAGLPTPPDRLEVEDFHGKDTSKPISITVTFENLSAEAQDDLKDYHRQGQLVITAKAEWDSSNRVAQVKHYGNRLGMIDFAPYFAAEGDGATLAVLTPIYAQCREKHAGLPNVRQKQQMTSALRDFEVAHPELCTLLPSEDQFYGISRGANKLEKYVQWVFVPAVKDATDEQLEARDTALGRLLERTVRLKAPFGTSLNDLRQKVQTEYAELLLSRQNELALLSKSLTERLQHWAHPSTRLTVEWQMSPETGVRVTEPLAGLVAGEGAFDGKLGRFGHGLQRSFLLALLQELSSLKPEGPRLLLAVEEPELFQHPPQARHLVSVLETLSGTDAQVIVCTHSPLFVPGRGFESVRLVHRCTGAGATCRQVRFSEVADDLAAAGGSRPEPGIVQMLKVHQALTPRLNEMFFADVLVLVEGLEDCGFLTAHLNLTDRISEFRRHGVHIVPVDGKSKLQLPLAIAQRLGIPVFVVFDGDRHETDREKRARHEEDNLCIQRLAGVDTPNPFPEQGLKAANLHMWATEMARAVCDEVGAETWIRCGEEARRKCQAYGVGGLKKNALWISYQLAEVYEQGHCVPCLDELADRMIRFAREKR